MWTAPGKTWLSVRTVKPLERVVTLYSGAWSTASNGLWLYNNAQKGQWLISFSRNKKMLQKESLIFFIVSYLEGSSGIVFGDWVCGGVFVNNIEHSRQDSRVRSEISSLHDDWLASTEYPEHRLADVWARNSTYDKGLEVLALWFEGLAQHLSFWIIILITKSNLWHSFLSTPII
jgi:hypothetical protein